MNLTTKIVLTLFVLFFGSFSLYSQGIEAQARQELERRGLGDEEVRKRLLDRGIDINQIDINNPDEIFAIEKSLREVINELESEKLKNNKEKEKEKDESGEELTEEESKSLAKEGENISEAIDEGATLEEAVSEELIELQENELPPATMYGQEIFRNQDIKLYRKSESVKPPDSYQLGTGDIVAVSIWGYSEEDLIFEINKDGFIKPEGIPRIYLKGLSFGKSKELLQKRFSNYYRFTPNQFEVSLNFGRTINVNIVGEVYNYGTFNIPAINTAFNALVAAGGPNDNGSVRNIKLIREGQEPRNIDVYEYLLNPTHAFNLYLEENDILFVPVLNKLVALNGAIIKPNKYELKEKENLVDLLQICGGLKSNASLKNIQIIRYEDDDEKIINVNLSEILSKDTDFELKNGDRITVFEITENYENFVSLMGAVEKPGEYAIVGETRLSDLFERTKLKDNALLETVYIKRTNKDDVTQNYFKVNLKEVLENKGSEDDIILQPKDVVQIQLQSKYINKEVFSVNGYVRDPSEFPFDFSETIRVSDAIFLAGGLQKFPTDFGYIKRKDNLNPNKVNYIRINIKDAMEDYTNISNIELSAGDILTVYSQKEFLESKSITTAGAVRKPTEIPFAEGIKVSEIIELSGGLKEGSTDFAYVRRIKPDKPKEVEYLRIDLESQTDDFKVEPDDQIVFYLKSGYVDAQSVTIEGAVRNPGEFSYSPSITIRDLITMSGGLVFNASRKRVDIFRLDISDDNRTQTLAATITIDNNDIPSKDITLQPFDRIIVRNAPEFELMNSISLNGEVRYPGDYALIEENETILNVIERAGGFTEEAFPEAAKVYRTEFEMGLVSIQLQKALRNPNSSQNILLKDGDRIVIPKKQDLITIIGKTRAYNLYDAETLEQERINVPYEAGKNAKYYVNNFAGGVDTSGTKRRIDVIYQTGVVKRTRNFLFFKNYPKVKRGATIKVGEKKKKVKKEKNREGTLESTLAKLITAATSVLTLLLLARNL